jgi:hypothetical protein
MAAALSAIDSTGVRQDVIDTVRNWRDWLDGVDDRGSSHRDFDLKMENMEDYEKATVRDARPHGGMSTGVSAPGTHSQ